VAHQVLEEVELTGREIDTSGGTLDSACYQVDVQVGDTQPQGARCVSPAQQHIDTRQKLGDRKRFHQVIIGARGQAADAIIDAVLGGQDQDQAVLTHFAPGGQDLQPVAAGQAEIQHDQVESVRTPAKEAVFPGSR
jgi:hypothetical protein